MITKSIAITTILCISYFIFVSSFAPAYWSGTGNDLQPRSVKVEDFLYNTDISNKNIIFGTSLAERIVKDSIPNIFNLSLAALGVFDGLYLLSLKNEIPKCIFIEMNFIDRGFNEDFKKTFSNPSLTIKKHIKSLREDKQPMVVLGNLMMNKVKSLQTPQKISNTKPSSQINEIDSALFNLLVMNKVTEFSLPFKDSVINLRLQTLAEILKTYENKGTKIVFFEMPINHRVQDLPYFEYLRKAFYNKFPKSSYTYIDKPDSLKFQTLDGTHLGSIESKWYSFYFKKSINDLQIN